MATVDKAFRIKNGLVVEGSSATVNGSNVLTEASTEFLQDTTAAMFTNGTQSGITFTYNDSTGVIDAAVSTTPTFDDKIIFEGTTPDAYELTLQVVDPTQDVTVTLPNATDTLVGKATTDTLTNKTISGSDNTLSNIGNGSLTNSSITVNGATISLGGSDTITAANPNALTIGTGLNGTSYDGSSAVTIEIDSTVTTNDGTQTLTNKTISGSSNTISDIANGSLTNDSITVNGYSTALGSSVTLDTDDVSEGTTNKYFADELAVDAVAAAIANGTQTNITITYDDAANSLSFNASGGVSSLTGTANEIEVSSSTGAVTIGLPSSVTFPGTVTLNADPTQGLQAATKQYVDAVAEGLNVHAACVAATTTNINLATDLEAGDIIDGVTLVAGDRVLVKNQSTSSQNGIYIASSSGAASRASDFDTPTEVVPGDFVFVSGGTNYNNTGWVQTDTVATIGTDPINFTQFSGAGTYLAGNGLSLTGSTFAIDTTVTVDVSTAQTLTNKTISGSSNTLSDIANGSLTNSSVTINSNSLSLGGTLTLDTDDISEGTTNKYFSDTLARGAVSAGTGLSYASTSGVFTNEGVTSITGTADQITASASTGAVTLSLPQSIATTSSPTFAGLSVGSGSLTAGSLALTDALLGTATTSIADTSATVVDSWSKTTYNSAKYIVQMKNGNDIEVLEVLVTVDGNNNVYLTEYADIQSNTQLGTTDADYSGGNVRLLVTSTNGTTVKVHKTLIEA